MTTGEKIAECRKEKELTQSELAEILGVTRQAVSRWEGDLAFPETDTLIKMSKLFGVSLDWLLKYDEELRGETQNSERQTDESERSSKPENGRVDISINFKNFHIEYKSKLHLGKLPLVHVNIGLGRTAKGVFAVGLMSMGVVSVGLLSLGIISLGLVCLGFISLACISGGVFAAGSMAFGVIALGGLAVGLFSMGGCAVGLFACGGYANGYYFAIGDVAVGGIALGTTRAEGSVISVLEPQYEVMKTAIYEKLENIPKIWSVFTAWSKGLYNYARDAVLNIKVKI